MLYGSKNFSFHINSYDAGTLKSQKFPFTDMKITKQQ